MPSNAPMIRQLRTMLQLTQAEAQIARTRVAQARTEAVRRELNQNADNAQRRSRQIAAELRALGGVPDVVSPVVGRLTALAKATLEQARPLDEALLQDLALEQQLQARARYLKALARSASRASTEGLADTLESAHTATVEWITTVLAEEALGGPAALRATPFQRLAGGATQAVNLPVRLARKQLDRAVDRTRNTAEEAFESLDEASRRARKVGSGALEVLTSGRDAALGRAETVARREGADDTATAVHGTRRDLGALTESELPIQGYDRLGVQDAIKEIKALTAPEDVRAIVHYEEAHRDRANVVSAAQTRLAAIAQEVAGVTS